MSNEISSELLENLVPIKELNAENRTQLVNNARVDSLQPGQKLAAAEEHDWLVYLVQGKLSLASQASAAGSVEGDTPRAKLPVFAERVTSDFAVAESPTRILRLEKALFNKLLNDEHLGGYEVVADVEVQDYEGEIFQQIYQACQSENLDLPPMPEVAMRIRRMADDPDVGIADLAKVVQMDPAVAAGVLHAANSPLFRGTSQVSNIKDAMVRLGLKTTQSIATSIAMRETFKSKSPAIKQRMRKLWEHCVDVSALSFVIARKVGGFDPERALLAGLLHDIGAVPILNFLEQKDLNPTPQELEATIQKLHGMVGVLVFNAWGFDPELTTVVEESDDWMRDAGPAPDYCDIVLVAQLYSYLDTPRAASLPKLDQTPAFKKLKLGELDEQGHVAVLEEAAEEIAGIKQLLSV